jgi:hypothetical protein
MKAVMTIWSMALSLGLLAGLVTWSALDIIDPQASALVLAVSVGAGLAVASTIVAVGRKRQVFRDLDALAESPAPRRF